MGKKITGPVKASTLKMKRNLFKDITEKHMDIPQIAKKYGLSPTTVYGALQGAADKHGVTRESLLKQPKDSKGVPNKNGGRRKTSGRANVAETISNAINAAEEVSKAMTEEINSRM